MITAEIFEEALEFAIKAHKGQRRKGGDKPPYILHPFKVMFNIFGNKQSSNMYLLGAAAILHDVVEDCGIKIEEIALKFGYYVAALVEELTLDKTQYEKIGKSQYLLEHMNKMSSYALAIKLCDRLDNISDLDTMGDVFRNKYVAETQFIISNLDRKLTRTHNRLIGKINRILSKYTN